MNSKWVRYGLLGIAVLVGISVWAWTRNAAAIYEREQRTLFRTYLADKAWRKDAHAAFARIEQICQDALALDSTELQTYGELFETADKLIERVRLRKEDIATLALGTNDGRAAKASLTKLLRHASEFLRAVKAVYRYKMEAESADRMGRSASESIGSLDQTYERYGTSDTYDFYSSQRDSTKARLREHAAEYKSHIKKMVAARTLSAIAHYFLSDQLNIARKACAEKTPTPKGLDLDFVRENGLDL